MHDGAQHQGSRSPILNVPSPGTSSATLVRCESHAQITASVECRHATVHVTCPKWKAAEGACRVRRPAAIHARKVRRQWRVLIGEPPPHTAAATEGIAAQS